MKKVKGKRVSNNDLSDIITKSDCVSDVMKKAYPDSRPGAGNYKRVSKLMEKRGLKFKNGNVYFYKSTV